MAHFEDEDARWARYAPTGTPDECWEWRGHRSPKGYATFTHDGKRMAANRAALLRAGIPLGRDQFSCHKCNNPPCVNPAHLYAGSPLDNMQDAKRAGSFARRPVGERHHRAKLTDAQVAEIRSRAARGETATALGKEFGVAQASVSRYINNQARVNV